MYSFHASADAITAWWNLSFGLNSQNSNLKITRRQVWQAFVQGSLRMLGTNKQVNLTTKDNLPIDNVVEAAFDAFGNDGVISAASNHACEECTHIYKETADALQGTSLESTGGGSRDSDTMDVDSNEEEPTVSMAVVDGVVFGPTHCAFDGCSKSLDNYRGASFCTAHKEEWGNRCHVKDCQHVWRKPRHATYTSLFG
ncbi:hypothetical protein FA15DRAFT_598547 [Coprinopsis marcescibilis]|uniref:CxC6 like cysteine cluster associated with KDZ domain-containing protein n=1 Tax=Coprinopsis marcescibilis TaxID=230819 RepID=A0A5C3KL21_COPMA|nr:hypothetical protein FA15DRAFT_598547 [Coprinopsis marcescibilis]